MNTKNCKLNTNRHPQKSKCASKSFKFWVWMKSVVIVFWVFHPDPKLETLARRSHLRTREKPAPKEIAELNPCKSNNSEAIKIGEKPRLA